jgi:hypothetical protein
MVIGIAGDFVKRRIWCFSGETAAVETDRLQIVIYVADGSLNELRWGGARFGMDLEISFSMVRGLLAYNGVASDMNW